MDESQEILLSSLRSSGISFPSSISSIGELNPDAIVSICAQFLLLIDDSIPPFPSSLPVSTSDRFKLCEDLADAVRSSGYRGDLSFNQFLYPSTEDIYKLVRFLVERLAESSESRKVPRVEEGKPNSNCKEHSSDCHKGNSEQPNKNGVRENRSDKDMPYSAISPVGLKEKSSVCIDNVANSGEFEACDKEDVCSRETEEIISEGLNGPNEVNSHGERIIVIESGKKLASLGIQLHETNHSKELDSHNLEDKHELLRAAADMEFDDQHSAKLYIVKLNEQVEEKRCNLTELKSKRNALKQTSERKVTPQFIDSVEAGAQGKLEHLKQIEQETEATISKLNEWEMERATLLKELEILPKLPPRKSYIQRITELTKSSMKQDADIDRILKETRELQLEINSAQERLARTYAVVDEAVFREAKKDAVGRQVYRLLTSIHDSFEQISEKIMATDRARREAADIEAKLALLSARSFDINKLQSDLDSIRKENDLLEQQQQLCQDSSM